MANIPLQSITFPGLSDKYTTPVVDNTLTQAGAAADAKKTGDEVGAIKNDLSEFPNGNYPQMGAGYASQLVSGLKKEDQTPYNFRAVPYDATLEEVGKIVGGTVAWNQLVNKSSLLATTTVNGITFTNNGDGSITVNGTATQLTGIDIASVTNVPVGHKILVYHGVTGGHWGTYVPLFNYNGTATLDAAFAQPAMLYANTNTTVRLRSQIWSGQAVNFTMLVQLFDITQMFGTAIADYVYNLETATAGAGVAWLKKHFPAQFDSGYQAYDAGSLQSVSGLTMHRMTGFNQWDEEYELGVYATADGEPVPSTSSIRSKSTNYIPIVSGATYYFNTSGKIMEVYQYGADKEYISKINVTNDTITFAENIHYIRFDIGASYGTTYNHDICINLHWDGEKDGTYEPYKEYTYALDSSVVLRGKPKVDASGNLYYDGDEYLPDGTINRRYGIVDLGTLNWRRYDFSGVYVFFVNLPDKLSGYVSDGICSKYVVGSPTIPENLADKQMDIKNNQTYIYIRDDSYTTETDFINAVTGSYLVYTLATPTTETALPYQETQIVDDFGTEEFVLADGAFPVPVGHNTMYQNNLRAKLEMSPDSPDGDGLYVVQQESGENTYVPLASTSTIQDILTRLTALENA